MRHFFAVSLIGAAVTASASMAKDVPTKIWKDVGNWQVQIKPGMCLARTSWPGGTGIQLAFRPGTSLTDFVLSNPAWKPTDDDNGYDLIVQFGSQMPWRVPGNSVRELDLRIEGQIGFFHEMMQEERMVIRYAGKYVDELTLEDAAAAVFALKDCQNTWFGLEADG